MKKINMKLKTKLSLAFIFIAVVTVFLISVLVNFLLENQFRQYIIEKQQKQNSSIVKMIEQQYVNNSKWDLKTIQDVGMNALEGGLIVKVTDSSGKVIWDAAKHNNGLCEQMISHMTKNMISRYPNWNGKYTVNIYPIIKNNNKIGSITIGYYGPFFYNDSELEFINTLNALLIWISIGLILFSLILGAIMSRKISLPIARAVNAAIKISRGEYSIKNNEMTNTVEIDQLTQTIYNLAKTLETQEKLRKRLTSDVAHELRTPLATLQSHTEAMIDGIWQPSQERLSSCHEEIVRLSKLVGQLENLAQYEEGRIVLNKENYDIKEQLTSIITNFESDFRAKKITINLIGESQIVLADRDMLAQVLINIISNSLKYSFEGGRVEVKIENNNKSLIVSIKDNGAGISNEDLQFIFERFYRVDKSRNRMTGGAGIGLTIAAAIVKAHGGEISVESKLGEGSKFIITIPS